MLSPARQLPEVVDDGLTRALALIGGADALRPPAAAGLFDAELWAALRAQLPPAERAVVRRVLNDARSALLLTRRGRLGPAAVLFEGAHRFVDGSLDTSDGRGVASTFVLAAEAYHRARTGDLAGAEERVHAALRLDDDLARNPAFAILHGHRVQLGHNLVRLASKDGRTRDAVVLAADLLASIEGDEGRWPLPGAPLDHAARALVPMPLLAGLHQQIAGEVAQMLAGRARDAQLDLLRAGWPALVPTSDVPTPAVPTSAVSGWRFDGDPPFALVHAWLRSKASAASGPGAEELQVVAGVAVLEHADAQVGALWLDTARDLVVTAEELGWPGAPGLAAALSQVAGEVTGQHVLPPGDAWALTPPGVTR